MFGWLQNPVAQVHIKAIEEASPTTRPYGLLDWMHDGVLLRYGFGERVSAEDHWQALNKMADRLRRSDIKSVASLFERHAWNADRLQVFSLAEWIWPRLSRKTRGHFME